MEYYAGMEKKYILYTLARATFQDTSCPSHHYSQEPRGGNNARAHQWTEGKDTWYFYNRVSFGHEKGQYPAICDNVDGPCACHAKGDRSERERRVLCDHLHVEPKEVKPVRTVKRWLPRKGFMVCKGANLVQVVNGP